ncbi:hypothetical protein RCL1_004320 [Eukaryota sp. TZLM3-RCL]
MRSLVLNVPSSHPLSDVSQSAPLSQVFSIFNKDQTCVLVRCDSHSSILGLLDISDVVKFIATHYRYRLDELITLFESTEVASITSLSHLQPLVFVDEQQTVVELCQRLIHIRSVVVSNEECLRLVTQLDLLKYISSQITEQDLQGVTVAKVRSRFNNTLQTFSHTEKLFNVIVALSRSGCHSAAILSDTGELMGNFSVTDICSIYYQPSLLNEPVLSTVAAVRLRDPVARLPAYHVSEHDTLFKAIEKLCKTGVSHLFLTNDSNKPNGVLTVSNVLQELLSRGLLPQ